jgi:hypothetical protein
LRGNADSNASNYYVLVSATLGGLVLSMVATGRSEFSHINYLGPFLFLVLAWILDGRGMRSLLLAKGRPLLVVFLLIFFTAFGLVYISGPLFARERLSTRRGILRASRPDALIQYVQQQVPPGGKIFVYPYQPLIYFLTGTFSPTPYEYLQPGMHTSAQFQDAIHRLAAAHTQTVVFDLTFSGEKAQWYWPSTPLSALTTDPVKDFIFSEYRACRTLTSLDWRFVFMVRKDLPCGDDQVGSSPKQPD